MKTGFFEIFPKYPTKYHRWDMIKICLTFLLLLLAKRNFHPNKLFSYIVEISQNLGLLKFYPSSSVYLRPYLCKLTFNFRSIFMFWTFSVPSLRHGTWMLSSRNRDISFSFWWMHSSFKFSQFISLLTKTPSLYIQISIAPFSQWHWKQS